MNIYEYAMYRQARILASELLRGKKLTSRERRNARVLFDLTLQADDQSDCDCEDSAIEKIYQAGKILREVEESAAK